ncbi:VanZ family protein [Streptomyces sp. NPDC052095]|uniref:VanZ family protein n=1 Tax=unclassified Streptomyces TaxID=2593676 RepID=UPI003450B257
MLNAVFHDQEFFLASLIAISLICGLSAHRLTRGRDSPSWAVAAFVFFLVTALGVTLFLPGGGTASGTCTVNRDFTEPFKTEQGILNAAMCVPLGLSSILAVRRVLPVVVYGVLAPVIVELAQATLPWISRTCDSSDAEMNVIGVLLGAGLGCALLKLRGSRIEPWRRGAKRTAVVGVGALTVCACVWNFAITPLAVDATSLRFANAREKDAARAALKEAFGDRYSPVNVQVQPGYDGGPETLLIALTHSSASLSWPDRANFSVELEAFRAPNPDSFPVDGASGDPENADAAYAIAHRYAISHYGWALKGTDHESTPVGDGAESGWLVSWRNIEDGVVMPRRLDVQIDRAGRVSRLNVQRGPLSVALPPRRVDRARAESIVTGTFPKGSRAEVEAGRLTAVMEKGEWRARWGVTVAFDASDTSEMYVDAETGEVSP